MDATTIKNGKPYSKRPVELVVLSDIHLGNYGCQAKSLLSYLKSIQPKQVVLNGDIVDIWQFNKKFWPKSHMRVIKHIMDWLTQGIPIYYITGNHDETMRKFAGFELGNFQISNKLSLTLDGKKAWFFHGDVFDVTMQHSKWIMKLGAIGYEALLLLNAFVNFWLHRVLKRKKIRFSKKIKEGIKKGVNVIKSFEMTAADFAISHGYDYVACGHIHKPEIKKLSTSEGEVLYLNSGDWIENLTSLEYNNGEWEVYHYHSCELIEELPPVDMQMEELSNRFLFLQLVKEFEMKKA